MLKTTLNKSLMWLIAFFGLAKISRRYGRFETWTKYVPANEGNFLKSLESDVGPLQE
jgi:hypothetical protein